MRPIKFKAIRKDNGEWVEGDYTSGRVGDDERNDAYISQGVGSSCIEVLPETVCQYTGRQEIWEGSICRCRMNGIDIHVEEVITEVIYDLTVGAFGHKVISKDSNYTFFGLNSKNLLSCEIIGNIHNPQTNKL